VHQAKTQSSHEKNPKKEIDGQKRTIERTVSLRLSRRRVNVFVIFVSFLGFLLWLLWDSLHPGAVT